jgi:alpha-ribazole phosphatase
MLPRDAVWYSSNLKRTHKTAEAIWAAGYPKPASMTQERDFAEQHLGRWQGMNRAALLASQPPGRSWFADVNEPAPGGESFMDLYTRVCRTIVRITAAEAGRNIIAVGHGGVIRAAVGLALGGQPDRGLSFDVDNVSVTRLDHIAGVGLSTWRLPMVDCRSPTRRDASAGRTGSQAGEQACVMALSQHTTTA